MCLIKLAKSSFPCEKGWLSFQSFQYQCWYDICVSVQIALYKRFIHLTKQTKVLNIKFKIVKQPYKNFASIKLSKNGKSMNYLINEVNKIWPDIRCPDLLVNHTDLQDLPILKF